MKQLMEQIKKHKKIVIGIIILVIMIGLSLTLLLNKSKKEPYIPESAVEKEILGTHNNKKYSIETKEVDERSPDLIITVYEDDKEIEFKEIRYYDNVLLCSGDNPTINKFDLSGEKTLIIILKDDTKVKVNIN